MVLQVGWGCASQPHFGEAEGAQMPAEDGSWHNGSPTHSTVLSVHSTGITAGQCTDRKIKRRG